MDEGKLLLFIKDEVASCAPKRGRRLNAERQRKRRAKALLEPSLPPPPPPKKRRGPAGAVPVPVVLEGDDDESCSDIVLMYNTVRGYYSAVNEL